MRLSRHRLATLIGVLISAGLLTLALRNVDAAELTENLAQARWWVVAPFLLSLFAYYWVKTVRWSHLLQPVVAVTPRRLFVPVMIGYAAGAILPMQLGELVRAWLCAKQLNIRVLAAFMSIALERVFDLISILLLVAVVMLAVADASATLAAFVLVIGCTALAALSVFLLFVFRTEQCLQWIARLLGRLPPSLSLRILDQLRAGAAGLGALRSVRLIGILFATSLLQWVFMFSCVWLSLYAMDLRLSPVAAMLAMVFTMIGTSLPNSPGYVGSIQLAFTLALEPFGVGPTQAIAASLFFHVLAYLSVVITGVALLPTVGLGARELAGRAQALSKDIALTGSVGEKDLI